MGAYLGKFDGGDRSSKKKHVDHQGEGAGMKLIDLTEAKKMHTFGHVIGDEPTPVENAADNAGRMSTSSKDRVRQSDADLQSCKSVDDNLSDRNSNDDKTETDNNEQNLNQPTTEEIGQPIVPSDHHHQQQHEVVDDQEDQLNQHTQSNYLAQKSGSDDSPSMVDTEGVTQNKSHHSSDDTDDKTTRHQILDQSVESSPNNHTNDDI